MNDRQTDNTLTNHCSNLVFMKYEFFKLIKCDIDKWVCFINCSLLFDREEKTLNQVPTNHFWYLFKRQTKHNKRSDCSVCLLCCMTIHFTYFRIVTRFKLFTENNHKFLFNFNTNELYGNIVKEHLCTL